MQLTNIRKKVLYLPKCKSITIKSIAKERSLATRKCVRFFAVLLAVTICFSECHGQKKNVAFLKPLFKLAKPFKLI